MSISSLNADLDAILQHVGVAVTSGAQTGYGRLVRAPVMAQTAGGELEVVGDSLVLILRNGAITNLAMDASITVDGTTYKIRDIGTPLTDGTRRVTLSES